MVKRWSGVWAWATAVGSWPRARWRSLGRTASCHRRCVGEKNPTVIKVGSTASATNHLLGWHADHGADRGGDDQRALQIRELPELAVGRERDLVEGVKLGT